MQKPARHFRIYRRILRLYPPSYRTRYGEEHILTLQDMLDDEPTKTGKLRIWLRTAVDTPRSLVIQNVNVMEDAMRDIPNYVKVTGLLTGLLVLPAVAAIVANLISALVFGQTLFNTWFWSNGVKEVWVFLMPLAACLVGAFAFLYFLIHQEADGKRSLAAKLLDVSRSWPILVSGLLAFGLMFIVLFHDSVHCWVRNPIDFVTQTSKMLQCTRGGFLGGKSGK